MKIFKYFLLALLFASNFALAVSNAWIYITNNTSQPITLLSIDDDNGGTDGNIPNGTVIGAYTTSTQYINFIGFNSNHTTYNVQVNFDFGSVTFSSECENANECRALVTGPLTVDNPSKGITQAFLCQLTQSDTTYHYRIHVGISSGAC